MRHFIIEKKKKIESKMLQEIPIPLTDLSKRLKTLFLQDFCEHVAILWFTGEGSKVRVFEP